MIAIIRQALPSGLIREKRISAWKKEEAIDEERCNRITDIGESGFQGGSSGGAGVSW